MFILAALFLTGVTAFPTTPFVAIIPPPGTNFTFLIPPNTMFYKTEFQFMDFQMNQTAPFATDLVQNMEIFVNMTFGPYPGFPKCENFPDCTFTSDIPTSVQGYTQLYNGTYNGGMENKINIDRTLTADTCGMTYDKGYMDVWVRPTNPATAGVFREGYFTCFYNITYPTNIVHEGESQWSSIFQCNSGPLNNYSFRLWYQFRFYNIESKTCKPGFFHSN